MADAGAADLDRFRRWALGDLVSNRNRGIYAEWLVGQALGLIGPDDRRIEWDAADLRYRGHDIEVKAGGRGQRWDQTQPTPVRFDIVRRHQAWHAQADTLAVHPEPLRCADVYVFCLHTPIEATNDNVADAACWEFRIVGTKTLDSELGAQRPVGISTLNRLTDPVEWAGIRTTVDAVLETQPSTSSPHVRCRT